MERSFWTFAASFRVGESKLHAEMQINFSTSSPRLNSTQPENMNLI